MVCTSWLRGMSFGRTWRFVNLSGICAVASGVLYYAAAYWLYLTALRRAPASLAAVSFYLIPVFGVAGGQSLLHERFEASQWVGVTIVLAAVLSAYVGQRRTMPVARAE